MSLDDWQHVVDPLENVHLEPDSIKELEDNVEAYREAAEAWHKVQTDLAKKEQHKPNRKPLPSLSMAKKGNQALNASAPRKKKSGGTGGRSSGGLQPVAAPVALGVTRRGSAPKMSGRNGELIVEHSELACAVYTTPGSLAFSSETFDVSATSALFNWLTTMASGYERYAIDSLEFTYVSATGSSQPGLVSMCYDVDPTDAAPESMSDMASLPVNVDFSTWATGVNMAVPRHAMTGIGKVLNVSYPNAGDDGSHDPAAKILSVAGRFTVATEGVSATELLCGRVFVRYKVRLIQAHASIDGFTAPFTQTGMCVPADALTATAFLERVGAASMGAAEWPSTSALAVDSMYKHHGSLQISALVEGVNCWFNPQRVGRYLIIVDINSTGVGNFVAATAGPDYSLVTDGNHFHLAVGSSDIVASCVVDVRKPNVRASTGGNGLSIGFTGTTGTGTTGRVLITPLLNTL